MTDDRPILTLGHSPDPDDAFMWWPLTGMVARDGSPIPGADGRPAIDTGPFRYRAAPADIETLNRRAAGAADLDITALSARAYADAAAAYRVTACGGSFGDGYGPRVVCKADAPLHCAGCLRAQKPVIAVPGTRTTAYLVLCLMVGSPPAVVELPFDRVIGAVESGAAQAGLVIHEAQLTFADRGLRQVADLGAWWSSSTGLPLPLGLNAVRRDLDLRLGAGATAHVVAALRRSIDHAMAHRDEALRYARSFAMTQADRPGLAAAAGTALGSPGIRPRDNVPPELAPLVERFVDLYVNRRTIDMGESGRRAIDDLLAEGARAGLCRPTPPVDPVA